MTQPLALARLRGPDGQSYTAIRTGNATIPIAAVGYDPDTTIFDLLQDWHVNLSRIKSAVAAGLPSPTSVLPTATLAPLPEARQIFCTGANYRKHVAEMVVAVGDGPATAGMSTDELREYAQRYVERQAAEASPYVFMKPVTAIAGPEDRLVLPAFSAKIDWEIEVAAVIGKATYQVSRSRALDHVAGYMIANDITARDKVRRTDPGAIGADWLAAKGAPGFLPIGPLFVPAEFIAQPLNLRMRLLVNGEVMQDDSTSDMTFDIARQVEWISSHARLLPGDILCTGSPSGNGVVRGIFLKDGDVMQAEIEGLGSQSVVCAADASRA